MPAIIALPTRRGWWRPALLAALLACHPGLSATETAGADSDLQLVIIVTRHGVRSPLMTYAKLDQLSAQPWPRWPVALGVLTAHGTRQMVLMGEYYRALYRAQGLLTGNPADDAARIFFRADNDQRTIATARALAAGLLPGTPIDIVARPADEIDPMFRAAAVPVGKPDRALGVAAVLGRIGGDPARVDQACQPALVALQHVLFGDGGVPPGKTSFLATPTAVQPGKSDHTASLTGAMGSALSLTDTLLLEYTEGLPMSEVGWGRLTPEGLTQLLQLHAVSFGLADGTFYPAQVGGSNLAQHILQTLGQAATGRTDPGAFGNPGQRLVVVVGHDTNIINLGGLLGLEWLLPGTQLNPVLPGGALVFELRRQRTDGRYFVRTYYASQTLDQIRNLDGLTLQHPPAVAPIFVPGCSTAGPGFDAPLESFTALLRRVIDQQFTLPGAL